MGSLHLLDALWLYFPQFGKEEAGAGCRHSQPPIRRWKSYIESSGYKKTNKFQLSGQTFSPRAMLRAIFKRSRFPKRSPVRLSTPACFKRNWTSCNSTYRRLRNCISSQPIKAQFIVVVYLVIASSRVHVQSINIIVCCSLLDTTIDVKNIVLKKKGSCIQN